MRNPHSIFKSIMPIESDRIFLRKLTETDVTPTYCSWLNDPEVNKYLETKSATLKSLKKYVQAKIANPHCVFMGIFDKATGKHIGNVKLEPIDRERGSAVFGIMIGDKNYWGKGFGTEATKLFVQYAFYVLGLSVVSLGVIENNASAVKSYQKAGFTVVRSQNGKIEMEIRKKNNP